MGSNVANDFTIDPATSNDELVMLLKSMPQIEQGMQKSPTEAIADYGKRMHVDCMRISSFYNSNTCIKSRWERKKASKGELTA